MSQQCSVPKGAPFGHHWWSFLLIFLCWSFAGASQANPDHSHLTVVVDIPTGEVSAPGDALGLYAVQLQRCDATVSLSTGNVHHRPSLNSTFGVIADTMLSVFIGAAHANHRERFDGPAASEFRARIALGSPGRTSLGELLAPTARYCGVLLTLARLPAGNGLPALDNSLRLSVPDAPPLEIAFRETITLTLGKPWQTDGQPARLQITLRPRAVQALLLRSPDDFGVRSQRAIMRLAEASSATVLPQ